MDKLNILRSNLAPGFRKSKAGKAEIPNLHEKELNYLTDFLQNVLVQLKSGSLFFLGPPSSGKTTLLETAIKRVADQRSAVRHAVIRLNGKICTNFRSSVECLCKQLGKTEELDDVISSKSHFDEKVPEILQFLKESLASTKLAIIVVLDNVELFCEHKGQALLYNLMDAVLADGQHRLAPICVIGVTTRQDILQILEKRVKSRFSHRVLNLESLIFAHYFAAAENMLSLKNEDHWNENIKSLFLQNIVRTTLQGLFDSDSTIGTLICFLYSVLLQCEDQILPLCIQKTYEDMYINSRTKQIMDLNYAELFVLATINKVVKNSPTPTFKFDSICTFSGKSSQSSRLNKNDLMDALISLENLELVTAVDKKGNKMETNFKAEITTSEIDHALKTYPNLPTDIQAI